jgi:hypothetical protein
MEVTNIKHSNRISRRCRISREYRDDSKIGFSRTVASIRRQRIRWRWWRHGISCYRWSDLWNEMFMRFESTRQRFDWSGTVLPSLGRSRPNAQRILNVNNDYAPLLYLACMITITNAAHAHEFSFDDLTCLRLALALKNVYLLLLF